ncbi:MAG: nucleotide exchange factor GrpE, partial [Myxococcota bacterium]
RALETLPGTAGPWHDGLLAVQSRLDGLFEQEGLHRIGEPGERFDPKLHDAIGTVPEGTPGDVRHTVSTGLARDDGSVVVPAKVIVAAQTR